MNKLIAVFISLFLILPCKAEMTFDGIDDIAKASDFDDLGAGSTQLSVACWVKGAAQSVKQPFSHWETSGNQRSWSVSTGGASTNKFRALLSKDGTVTVGSYKDYESSIVAYDSTWHHVAFTYDNGTLNLYVDGVLDTGVNKIQDPAMTTLLNSTGELSIACVLAAGAGANFFSGSVDDARIYTSVLTAQQIQSLAQSRSRLLITDGLVANWRLDDGKDAATASGATVKDASENGRTATPTGGPTWSASIEINYP